MLISNLSYIHTGVPVGTTEFILIRSLYGDTRRYYRTYTYFTDTGVPVGTTGLILILLIREYPYVLLDLYLF